MQLNFFTILTIISVFITAVLSLFFFVNKKGFILENRLFAILLMIFNLQIFYSFATSNYAFQYFMDWHRPLFIIRQTSFLIGPLIYLYINTFRKKLDIHNFNYLAHFLPFAGSLLFLMIYYLNTDRFVIWKSYIDLYDTILILAHNFIYIVFSLLSLKSVTPTLKGFYKSIFISSSNTWIQMLLIGFILVWIVNLNSFALYMIIQRPVWCAYTASIYALTAFLFINTIMFVLLWKPDAYYVIAKYKNTKLQEPDKMGYIERLSSYMETEKPYLNPDITLENLATELSVNPRILSQIINETYKKNFKSYILEYRLKESMKILADSRCSKLTVLEILYQVGFNSKSAFNNQFKLFTNLTPLEYRAKCLELQNSPDFYMASVSLSVA
ncbi:MAG: helix-turn-helix transcriptional regulator [Bacteroidetes bacterium]|nr:helix-turn-helix transcriptional regulator [Bacteroidota bacterium]